jgi:hypothetical protein
MSLFELLEKISAAEGDTVEIEVPEENFNLLMLRILQGKAKKRNKKLTFSSTGPHSERLITALDGEEGQKPVKGKVKRRRLRISFGNLRRFTKIPFLLLGILLFVGGGAYWVLYYLPRADVVLTLSPIPLVKEISVAADIAAEEVDVEEGIIPGTLHTVKESGEKTADATGTATVGEKASGTVTFINCVDTAKTFPAGTVVKVEGKDLSYTLNGDISDVPPISGSTCGNKTGSITATSIGSQYNQGEGVEFDFIGISNDPAYNVYVASGQSISGGTSEEVTIISAGDQADLLEEFKEELVEQGKASIASEGGIDEVIVGKAIKSEVVKKGFSHAVGEQTDKLKLTLEMKFTLITYEGSDMQDLISQAMGVLIPEGYTLFPGETNIEPLEPKLSKNKLSFQAKVSAKVVPEINVEDIKINLARRNPESAQEYLSSLGEVTAYELKLWPNLPSGLQRVPRNTDRITVTLVTEE